MTRARSVLSRWAVPAAGIAMIAALVTAGLRQEENPAPAPRTRSKAPRPATDPSEQDAVESWTLQPDAVPLDPVTEAQTARAMDEVGLQYQVTRLRMAALAGDPDVTESVHAGLQLYGKRASVLLASEIEREPDPVVRWAFAEARKSLR